MDVCNIVWEAVTKTIPKKKKFKKAKWLSEEAFQVTEERRWGKGKEERERYTQLKAELQRSTGRDKRGFLSEQCGEIEENNRMGNARCPFKKVEENKGIFHERIGTIKDKNGKDLI